MNLKIRSVHGLLIKKKRVLPQRSDVVPLRKIVFAKDDRLERDVPSATTGMEKLIKTIVPLLVRYCVCFSILRSTVYPLTGDVRVLGTSEILLRLTQPLFTESDRLFSTFILLIPLYSQGFPLFVPLHCLSY